MILDEYKEKNKKKNEKQESSDDEGFIPMRVNPDSDEEVDEETKLKIKQNAF